MDMIEQKEIQLEMLKMQKNKDNTMHSETMLDLLHMYLHSCKCKGPCREDMIEARDEIFSVSDKFGVDPSGTMELIKTISQYCK